MEIYIQSCGTTGKPDNRARESGVVAGAAVTKTGVPDVLAHQLPSGRDRRVAATQREGAQNESPRRVPESCSVGPGCVPSRSLPLRRSSRTSAGLLHRRTPVRFCLLSVRCPGGGSGREPTLLRDNPMGPENASPEPGNLGASPGGSRRSRAPGA